METKTIQTHHVPVRYFEGGKGEPLVFLHGAGGVTAQDPFLAKLAETHRVYAPLLPGYGDSEECGELRDIFPDYKDDNRFWCKPLKKQAKPGSLPAEREVAALVGGKD